MEAGTESQLTALGRKLGGLSVALAVGGGVWMRLWMLKALPQVSPDTLLYGGMAKNMLLHGQYAISDGSGVVHETLLRLPGYRLFLAACFRLFGIDKTIMLCAMCRLRWNSSGACCWRILCGGSRRRG